VTESIGSRPTLEEVAARAGVSRATVSRVVNGSTAVRKSLVERVQRAVEEMGYVPNQAARSLVTRRHDAIAVVVAEPETRIFADPFFGLQLRGISKELAAYDCQLVLLLTEGPDDYVRVGRYLAGGHVDGALAFSLHLDDPLPGIVRGAGLRTVFGGRPYWAEGQVAYVDCDNLGGARDAVRYLVETGRTQIAHITGPLDQTSAVDRLDGYREVLREPDPRLIEEGDFTVAGGERAMHALLDRCPGLDAVFAANDLSAAGALRALRQHGLTVPADVAVVGFDDMLHVAEQTDPPLTTVRQSIEEMGRMMVRLLLRDQGRPLSAAESDGLADDGTGRVITQTTLIRRASA
jgi:DNA-binding LacI/PurR family transcriptional regulator